MDLEEIEAELAADVPALTKAIKRGLLAAYGTWSEVESEYSGHVRGTILAIRAAVAPLL